MPLISNSNNVNTKRSVNRKPEKSTTPVVKTPTNDTKTKTAEKTEKIEKLDLNINVKKSSVGVMKAPNIDSLELPKTKDNGRLSSRFKISKFRELEELPPLKDSLSNERDKLFVEKLHQCAVVFDWNDVTSDLRYKEIKKNALLEVCEYLTSVPGALSDQVCKELVGMIGSNIFRTLPPNSTPSGLETESEDDEPYFEPSWPHLQHVYDVFLRFLESSDFSPSITKVHINNTFVLSIMDLFDCEDIREREYLKTILHRIYGKMVNLRAFIRKQINNIFYRLIYETDSFKGIGELLEILGSIINGFQVPLKEEHKVFLQRVLLPMHKVSSFGSFQPQLAFCVTEFIRKDVTMLKVVMQGLIKFWPKTQSLKEIMFLNELDECLELSNPDEFRQNAKLVFNQLAKCVSSQQFQVCERALLFWNNDILHPQFVRNIDIILPTTFSALYFAKQHWNKTIHGLVYSALKVMMDINQKLFDECMTKLKDEKIKELELNRNRQEWWYKIDSTARKHPLYKKFAPEHEILPTTSLTGNDGKIDFQAGIKEFQSEASNGSNISNNKKSRITEVSKSGATRPTKKL